MQADGVTPDAYAINAAINACERGGQWEEAEMLLQEMQALGLSPDRVTYNTAIAAAARAAQWEQSLRLLDATHFAEEQHKRPPHQRCCSSCFEQLGPAAAPAESAPAGPAPAAGEPKSGTSSSC